LVGHKERISILVSIGLLPSLLGIGILGCTLEFESGSKPQTLYAAYGLLVHADQHIGFVCCDAETCPRIGKFIQVHL